MPKQSTYEMQEIKKYLDPKTHENARAEILSTPLINLLSAYKYYQTDVIHAIGYTHLTHQKVLISTELFTSIQMFVDHCSKYKSLEVMDNILQSIKNKCDEFLAVYKIIYNFQ